MLVLLIMGSASLFASGDDPFPPVNEYKYSMSMTITGYVYLGSEKLTTDQDVTVAVYQGDEIRGKGKLRTQKSYSNFYMITVYGETTGEPLHFKVHAEGRTIEVDQGLKYEANTTPGTIDAPYYIYLPAPVVTTASSEGWATTCLPFNAKVPDGVTVWNATGIADGQLVIQKADGTILPANTPVLLSVESSVSPFEWLSRVADGNISTNGSIFVGTTEKKEVEANSVLTLGHSKTSGEIGFWLYTGTTIPANRAYIADFPTNSRGAKIAIDDITTNIQQPQLPQSPQQLYDLYGRITNGQPTMWKKNAKGQIIIIR
jgi:hypothetical protein